MGEVHSGHPASIWQWQTNANTFAIQQCHFGADTPKPTRFLTTLLTDDDRCHFGWPQPSGNSYCGPLPKSRGHVHQQLIGQQDGKWKTGPNAAYPPIGFANLSHSCVSLPASPLVGRGKDDTSALVQGQNHTSGTSSGASASKVRSCVASFPAVPVAGFPSVGERSHTHTDLVTPGSSESKPSGISPDQDGFDMAACGMGNILCV